MSPDLMKMILNDNSSQFSNQSTNGIECNQKSFILTSQPVYCQKIYLIQLKNYLCNLSNQIGVLISYGDLRSNQAVNSIVTNPRHQLALAIGTIYSAELIRVGFLFSFAKFMFSNSCSYCTFNGSMESFVYFRCDLFLS